MPSFFLWLPSGCLHSCYALLFRRTRSSCS